MIKYNFIGLIFILSLFACDKTSDNPRPNLDPVFKGFVEGKSIAGYEYKHHIKNGGKSPKVGARVAFHQDIAIGDSLIFSTRKGGRAKEALMPTYQNLPSPLPPDYVALRIMGAGDSLTIFQPLTDIPTGKLPPWGKPEDIVEYRIKLESVLQPEDIEAEVKAIKAMQGEKEDLVKKFAGDYAAGKLNDQLVKTESGLNYVVLKEGTGAIPKIGEYVKVHYSGILTKDLKPFDNTYQDGRTYGFPFGEGRVIKGWDEGLGYMKQGAQVVLFVPYTLAYGASGREPSIPAKADLAFYVELVEVESK